jgi:hypothetical protein
MRTSMVLDKVTNIKFPFIYLNIHKENLPRDYVEV